MTLEQLQSLAKAADELTILDDLHALLVNARGMERSLTGSPVRVALAELEVDHPTLHNMLYNRFIDGVVATARVLAASLRAGGVETPAWPEMKMEDN